MADKESFRTSDRVKPGNKYKAKLIQADEVKIKDIGLGGMLVEISKRLNVNSRYKIQIISSLNNEIITPLVISIRSFLRGTTKDGQNIRPIYEVAFKFAGLTDNEKTFIEKLYKKMREDQ